MNLILFEPDEIGRPLPLQDPRAQHLQTVLHRAPHEPFDCGVVDGPRGRGAITRQDTDGLHLTFTWGEMPPPLDPLWIVAGLPRPQTARKLLGEVAAFGIAGVCFFHSDKGEASYGLSRLWTSGEVRRLLLAGVAQAFCTRLPHCHVADDLASALGLVAAARGTRVALDNYEAVGPLTRLELQADAHDGAAAADVPAVLALGPERGWSAAERDLLRATGFTLVHLGRRVLRTETACIAGLTLLKARLGMF